MQLGGPIILTIAALALAACQRPATPNGARASFSLDGSDYSSVESKLAHGKRVAVLLGCEACHGPTLQGTNVSADEPEMGEMNAPNLSLLMPQYSDAEFERALRQGIPKDGREFWFMPSEGLQFLSDADMAALIAYLRTVPPGGKPMPPLRKGPLFFRLIETGEMRPAPEIAARFRREQPADLGGEHAYGRYVAMLVCSECHNSKLQGYVDFTPDLDIAGAYNVEQLNHLLTTGEGLAPRDLGMMRSTVRARLNRLTPHERAALIAYLKARAERPQ